MKSYQLFARSFAILILFYTVDAKAQHSVAALGTRIDSLVEKAVNLQLFSGNVLVANNGRVIYDKSFGKADYENNTPNTVNTQFQIGSITKDFTKVMILQLVEQNKLRLTDTLGALLSGFPPRLNGITVQQLLMHKSGLGSYTDGPPFGEDADEIARIKTIADILPYIKREPLSFKPGTDALYSNSGFVLLAAIIEKVTGESYHQALKEQILDKVGMVQTGFNSYVKPEPGKATGYLSNASGPLQSNTEMHIIGGGDGGIYSTTLDMLAFVNSMLHGNRLLTNDSKQIAFTNPFSKAPGSTWAEFAKTGKIALAGGAPGLSALWSANMETQNVVIVLSNFDEGTAEALGMRISAILNNKPVPPLHLPPAKYLYQVINTKGGKYFEENYKAEMQNSAMDPGNDMVLLDVGQQLLAKNEFDKAISLYKVYTLLFPKIVIAWNDLGDAYLKNNNKADAKKSYQQALIVRPGNPRATRALATL
ncbi:serine hydrolase [Mucilaginibacter flavidus]|uniref:serine hydrolase n=1 Tax=Mucilaginibacter flavidus TaxID=2949309 RepID=UPI00209218A2|nr:serine hydrolase [Mucilaginibacter flavidus]MCO5949183.1 serine hydrolase [Mucilaginibacter flavidus]